MDSGFAHLLLYAIVGFIAYTLLLSTARRFAQQRGLNLVAAWMSLVWWFVIDAASMILCFMFAASMYENWFPAEGLSESRLLGSFFASSQLQISDWVAIFFTLLTCAFAHMIAYLGILVKQEVVASGWREPIPFWSLVSGFVCVSSLGGFLAYQWESPVLALRTAELIGDKSVDKMLDHIVSVPNVGTILGGSWLLKTLWFMWPLLICFVAWGMTRSKLYYTQLQDQGETTVDHADVAPVVATTTVGQPETHQRNLVEDPRRVDPVAVPPSMNGHARADASAPEDRAKRDEELFPDRNETQEDENVQELIHQYEQERDARIRAEENLSGMHRHVVSGPLLQPNRSNQSEQEQRAGAF